MISRLSGMFQGVFSVQWWTSGPRDILWPCWSVPKMCRRWQLHSTKSTGFYCACKINKEMKLNKMKKKEFTFYFIFVFVVSWQIKIILSSQAHTHTPRFLPFLVRYEQTLPLALLKTLDGPYVTVAPSVDFLNLPSLVLRYHLHDEKGWIIISWPVAKPVVIMYLFKMKRWVVAFIAAGLCAMINNL